MTDEPNQPESEQPGPLSKEDMVKPDMRSARTLAMTASIAAPVSFIIGGMVLSAVALVCGILALAKVRRASKFLGQDNLPLYMRPLRQMAVAGIVIGAVALVINAIGVALMLPILMEALQTGDYTAILGEGFEASAPATGGGAWG